MATVTLSNSGTTTYPMKMRVTYTENGSGITITKVEGCRTDSTRTYDNDCTVLINGTTLNKGADFPANSAWKSWWTGSKVLSTYTATFTFNSNTTSIKNSKFVLKVTATKCNLTYYAHDGVASLTGPATANLHADITATAKTKDGYVLTKMTRSRSGTSVTITDCAGKESYSYKWPNLLGDTAFGAYAEKYTCKVVFHKNFPNDSTDYTYSETYTYGVSGQKLGQDSSGGTFGGWNSRDDYYIKGWAKTKTATTTDYTLTNAVSDAFVKKYYPTLDLYAIWGLKEYSITYYAQTGVASLTGPATVPYGSTFDVTASAQPGYLLSEFHRKNAGDDTIYIVKDCYGKQVYTQNFKAVHGKVTISAYAEPYVYVKVDGEWKKGLPYFKKDGDWVAADMYLKEDNSWKK